MKLPEVALCVGTNAVRESTTVSVDLFPALSRATIPILCVPTVKLIEVEYTPPVAGAMVVPPMVTVPIFTSSVTVHFTV
jgi:hypothetical protein